MMTLHEDRRRTGDSARVGSAPEPVRIDPDEPAFVVVRTTLEVGLYWLGVNIPHARAGEPEGIHHLRTTTRRFRTVFRLFRDLLEPAWADRMAGGFKELAARLGEVRDLDVMAARIRRGAEELGHDAPEALDPLFDAWAERHDRGMEAIHEALESESFQSLTRELATAVRDIPHASAAEEPCGDVLPGLVASEWKRLRRDGRALGEHSPNADFHEVRKQAKRARYAAEAVAHALDPETDRARDRFARRARAIQDALGEHQDAVVAAEALLRAARERPTLGAFNLAAGRLVERESRIGEQSRERFFTLWPRLDRRKVVRWLRR